jgi:hypothetical protein
VKSQPKKVLETAKKHPASSAGTKPRGVKRALTHGKSGKYPKQHPVAQRLHETVSQSVTGSRLYLKAIERTLPRNCDGIKLQLQELDRVLAGASVELHEIIKALRDGKL